MVKEKTYTLLTINNPLSLFINDPPDFFIQLSLCSSFLIAIILTWVILSEVVKYQHRDDVGYHIKDIVGFKNLSVKNVPRFTLPQEATNLIVRYSFVFIFYGLIFYDISYLIYDYMPNLKIIMLIGSIGIQILLIRTVYHEILKESGNDVDVKGFEQYDPFVNIILIVVSVIAALGYLFFPENILIRIFFLLPSIFLLALILFGLWEVGSIVLDCIPYKNEVIKKKAMPVYVCLFLIVVVLVFVLGYVTLNSISNEATVSDGTLPGLWRNVDGSAQYCFYENHTFTLCYNNANYLGCWANMNDTYYLTYGDVIIGFENRTAMTYSEDNNMMFAQKEPGFYIIKTG